MVIVDTSVSSDYFAGVFNPETEWRDAHTGRQVSAIADLILCEILQDAATDSEFEILYRAMTKPEIFQTGGQKLAIASAENYRILRKKGFTSRKTIDCWIATFCMREGHAILHRDRDYAAFETVLGLLVVHPGGLLHNVVFPFHEFPIIRKRRSTRRYVTFLRGLAWRVSVSVWLSWLVDLQEGGSGVPGFAGVCEAAGKRG
jgi:predicted nucleic acid-binding protein